MFITKRIIKRARPAKIIFRRVSVAVSGDGLDCIKFTLYAYKNDLMPMAVKTIKGSAPCDDALGVFTDFI